VIVVPELLWDRLIDLLLEPAGRVERVSFIDGVVSDQFSVATTVVVPDATLDERYYDVSAAQMSEAGKHLRRFRLQRIAQAHTHGGSWVGHSMRDDELAYSHEDGALSIVVPHHARHRPRLHECGLHFFTRGKWNELGAEEIDALVRVVPGALNFRKPVTPTAMPDEAPLPWWRRAWKGVRP
jgi:hypothetical protein